MRRSLRTTAILLLALTVVFLVYLSCGKDKTTTPPAAPQWTILVYADGNNNLDYTQGGNSYCIQDIQDLEQAGSSDQVQIVAMVASLRTGGAAKYYHIEHYPDDLGDNISSTMLENKGTKDMSDPATLREFLIFGMERYPAQKYMVVIDDHGGGWRGACEDEQNGSGNVMSMIDMTNAFSAALSARGVSKFDIVTYHACLMSMVEVAYQLRNVANYLVASEFSMPMESVLGANIWLNALKANPSTSAGTLADNITNAVYQTGIAKQKYVHMATTDLSMMTRLAAKIDNFATQIHTSTGEYWIEVLDAWSRTHYTQYDDPANIDIREFAQKVKSEPNLQNINLIRYACDSLIAALNDAISITSTNAPAIPRGGLTIYMPYLTQMYERADYIRLAFSAAGWASFLDDFTGIMDALVNVTLTTSCNPANGGTCARNPSQDTYILGDTVWVTATATTGWTFQGWSGDVTGTANPIGVIMNADRAITANFQQQQQQYTLTVTCNPAGGGTVTRNPNQNTYEAGDTVWVTANPTSGWTFSGWTGDIQSQSNPVGVIMNANKAITANFTQGSSHTVTINGTMSYPGHALVHPVAFLDTSHSDQIHGILFTEANPNTGNYTIQFELTAGTLEAYVTGGDDTDNDNFVLELGEPRGFYDANGNNQWDDMIVFSPGQTLNNANIIMFVPGVMTRRGPVLIELPK